MIINEEITLAEIDEAIVHISALMKEKYGNRLSHQRKAFLLGELDNLLDARLEAVNEIGKGSNREPESRSE